MSSQKTIIITGCSSGIGKATAHIIAEKGHTIIALNRKCAKTDTAFSELSNIGTGKKYLYCCDLSEPASIKEACDKILQEHKTIDILINNAGVFKTRETHSTDGTELTFAVNVRAPAMICKYIIPALATAPAPRVIFLSSELYKRAQLDSENIFDTGKYNGSKNYAHSKMLITLLAGTLSENIPEVTFYSLHPGVIATDVFRDYPRFFAALLNKFLAKPSDGAAPVIEIALGEQENRSGTYFNKTSAEPIKKISGSNTVKTQLYEWYKKL